MPNTLKTLDELIDYGYANLDTSQSPLMGYDFSEYKRGFLNAYNDAINGYIPPRFVASEITEQSIKNWLTKFNFTRGLYLFGDCGVGKTHNLYGIYKILIANKKFDKNIPRLEFTNVSEFFADLRSNFDNSNSEREIQRTIKTDNLLILDDFGTEKMSEWTEEITYRLINHRYEYIKPTIFSSNLSLEKLAERVGDRIVSRMVEMCDVIKVEGEDRRMKTEPK